MKYKAVIFDLDGTLINSLGVWEKIDAEFLAKRGIPVPSDYANAICALSFRETALYTIDRFSLTDTADELMHEWDEMAIYEYSHHVELKPYAKEYLELLKKENIKTGIATSCSPLLYKPVLSNNGILGFFDVICATDEVARNKEHPDIYLYTAKKLGVDPADCLVFEDIPQAIKSAKQAGMTVYGIYDSALKDSWEYIRLIADGALYDFANAPIYHSR